MFYLRLYLKHLIIPFKTAVFVINCRHSLSIWGSPVVLLPWAAFSTPPCIFSPPPPPPPPFGPENNFKLVKTRPNLTASAKKWQVLEHIFVYFLAPNSSLAPPLPPKRNDAGPAIGNHICNLKTYLLYVVLANTVFILYRVEIKKFDSMFWIKIYRAKFTNNSFI